MYRLLEGYSKSDLIKTLIDKTPLAYIILDEDFQIHYINKFFTRLRNLDVYETIGEYCYNLSNNGIKCKRCGVSKSLETGRVQIISRKDTFPDGSVRYIDDYCIPLDCRALNGKKLVLEIMVNRTNEMIAKKDIYTKYQKILSVFLSLIEAKDVITANHSRNVHDFAMQIGKYLDLNDKQLFELSLCSILHDLGKVKIPDEILTKKGRLTDEEYEIMKKHPTYSYEMLEGLKSFEIVRKSVKCHHEKLDGTGYPNGLKSDDIPLYSKIISVADTYDVITSRRPYKNKQTPEYALEEIKKNIGTQFDKTIVEAFLKSLKKEVSISSENDNIIDRVIVIQKNPNKIDFKDDLSMILTDNLLENIFKNVPCGYAIVDKSGNTFFVNDYFKKSLYISDENINYFYRHTKYLDDIKHCLNENKIIYTRNCYETKFGKKYFDEYSIPLEFKEGKKKYVIKALIDRTKEVNYETQFKFDFNKLVDMLHSIVDDKYKSSDREKINNEAKKLQKELCKLLKNL